MRRKKTLYRLSEAFKFSVQRVIALALALFGVLGFAQINKLDPRFQVLLDHKDKVAKGEKVPELELESTRLDKHMVVTGKGAKVMYSSIIYTKDAKRLKGLGILVQSEMDTFVTALISTEDIERLMAEPSVVSIEAPVFDGLHNDVSTAQSGASLLHAGVLNNTKFTGKNVLVGIYDSGIDWDHPDFRDPVDPTKSRIHSIWDQTITPTGTETSPVGFNYGVEYTRAMIEDEIDGTPANFVRQKDTNGHGTHVAGTVAGNGAGLATKKHRGFAYEADIVVVKGGNGSFSQANTVNSLTYFQNVATALGKPIVVNMSIGGQGGPHDGTAPHEVAVDDFTSSAPGRAVVISAGNDYGANLHAKADIPAAGTGTFGFTVATNTTSAANTINQFFIYGNNNNDVEAKVTAPDGQVYIYPANGTTSHLISGGAFKLEGYNYVSPANYKRYIQFQLSRVAGFNTDSQGTYTIQLTNEGSTPTTLHAWKPYETVATTVLNGNNEYIVGSPGNATSAITVAAYLGRSSWYKNNPTQGAYLTNSTPQEYIAPFSAQGPRADEVLKPEITASGMYVISSLSSDSGLAASNTSNVDGTYYRINQGTSMSAPGVAGATALLLQANPNLTISQIKQRLTQNAFTDAATGTVPNTRWGYGKLDIYEAVAAEIGCVTSEKEIIAYDGQNLTNSETNHIMSNNMAAIRFTPSKTGKIGGVSLYTPNGALNNFALEIQIRKSTADNLPGEVIASKTINPSVDLSRFTWNYVDLSDLNVQATYNEDFFIVINSTAGAFYLRAEGLSVDKRSYQSPDGLNWSLITTYDIKVRANIYEDRPEIKRLATASQQATATIANGKNYFSNNCQFISRIEKTASGTVSGEVTAKVWVDNAVQQYVTRRYEITPADNPSGVTGKVTLYFSQAEFDAYNANNATKLPTGPTDEAGKANLLIDKYAGTSTNNLGTPASYAGGYVTITPNAADVVWNATYNYWEVSFETTGFSGFFLRTAPTALATSDVANRNINIYPNPVKETLNIMAPAGAKTNVVIYDMSGKMVKESDARAINVTSLPKGSYVVELTTANTKVTKKIIKE
ncbi:S8/S53 family peptidase [Chryseobacterium sp. 6424]|uniref:S8/S53 family peptidase n=1 Tax=Chryseobacterium sp. 6424 TaxID=2039166 RepID=UPI0013CF12EF|nr:S8/S53 family peptidase [Chryseobacterium sp. 6424]